MSRTLVNISFCGSHQKGNEGNAPVDGAEHAEWLEAAVDLLADLSPYNWNFCLSMTGFPGICHVTAGRERDTYWRLMEAVNGIDLYWITMAANPSHQVGAAWCIRQGLECAGKLGYDLMLHTAEDIVPRKNAFHNMVARLDEGYDYVSERWGAGDDQLNTQFFGVRVPLIAGTFDPPAVSGAGCLERYMGQQLQGRKLHLSYAGLYRHTHDYWQWKQWAEEVR